MKCTLCLICVQQKWEKVRNNGLKSKYVIVQVDNDCTYLGVQIMSSPRGGKCKLQYLEAIAFRISRISRILLLNPARHSNTHHCRLELLVAPKSIQEQQVDC